MPTIKSATRSLEIGPGLPVARIGERINPTGKAWMQERLKAGDLSWIPRLIHEQEAGGANVIGVNVGMPSIDEPALLAEAVAVATEATLLPLYLDSSVRGALTGALKDYPHVPLVGSATGEEASHKELMDFLGDREAALVVMLNDETGVPRTAQARVSIAEKVLDYAASVGFDRGRLVFDCMAMSVGVDPPAGRETLQCIRMLSQEHKVATVIGLSNVSFGMPDRIVFNRAFVAMAVSCGLSAAIYNPNAAQMTETIMAADVLVERDEFAVQYLEWYRAKPKGACDA